MEIAIAAAAVFVLTADRCSKRVAVLLTTHRTLARVPGSPSAVRIEFRAIRNMQGSLLRLTLAQAVVTWMLCFAGLVGLLLQLPSVPAALACSVGALIGGATGNLLDRVRHGGVTDFIVIGSWPVFNLADVGMLIGCVGIAWTLL